MKISSLEIRTATPQVCDAIINNFKKTARYDDVTGLGLRNIECVENLRTILSLCRLVKLDLSSDYSKTRNLFTNDVISSVVVKLCPNLKSLSLCRRVEVNDTSIDSLCTLKHLQHLNLSYCDVSGKGLSKILSQCPDLKSLIASQCPSPNELCT